MTKLLKMLPFVLVAFVLSCQDLDDGVEEENAEDLLGRAGADCTSTLLKDNRLVRGEFLCSPNGLYTFGLSQAGKFSLIYKTKFESWSAGSLNDAQFVYMQSDGNLVVRNKKSQALWSSKTQGKAGATLTMQDDGRAVIRVNGKALWAVGGGQIDECPGDPNKVEEGECGCGVPEGTCNGSDSCESALLVNERLYAGEVRCSENGKYQFGMSSAGNLALREGTKTLWSANTCCGSAFVAMQSDGNLVMYDNNSAKWASNTVGKPGATLTVENDGTVVIRYKGSVIWSVGTSVGATDSCPTDPNKTEPGVCGCGVPEGTCVNSGVVDASTLKGKVMAGYQGWFMTAGDGANRGWRHWAPNVTPNASNISFEMWPDMREYQSSELYATSFKYSNGTNAGLYSAYNPATVDRHVKWMKDYGIDGVFVQRFIGEAVNMTSVRDRVLNNVRVASEKYGRVFVNMYDISGGNASTLVSDIKNDWMHLVDSQKITQSSRYLRHNGRPVLALWGFGFGDRVGTASQANELITWLTQTAPAQYRVALMGGIDPAWKNHSTEWKNVYKRFDVVSPWAVGRYADDNGADNFRKNSIAPDLAYFRPLGIDYMPVIFPGFSWWNLKNGTSPFNKIPRRGGKFFWRQAYNAVAAGSDMIYVAMYDEVDEGTAMFKIAENSSQVPTTGKFLTLNADGTALPSDWYLKLMGQCTRMLRKQIPLTSTIPINP